MRQPLDISEIEKIGDQIDGMDMRYIVPGLLRGLSILQLFTLNRPELTLTEIAAALGLTRSATYRLTYTLETTGFLLRSEETKRYRVSGLVLSLGFEYLQSREIVEVAQTVLQRLSTATQAASYLTELDGTDALHIARAVPKAPLVSNLQVGRRLPAHATATGRIILAYRPDDELQQYFDAALRAPSDGVAQPPESLESLIAVARADRARGYILHPSIYEPQVTSIAMAILDPKGRSVAAINFVAPHHLFDRIGGETKAVGFITTAAEELMSALGFRR